ncbi:MAG: carboxylating nicotinate-nucleotide diphosphorylase [Sedimentisphaerales bacterium]|nr:carboxylating nicotinate-nucleotide diphosphorylase [Sedimentisphaerales bacterium]
MILPDPKSYLPLIELAWREDYQYGDITSEATIPANASCTCWLTARENGIMSGMLVVKDILNYYDPEISIDIYVNDCVSFEAGQVLAELNGNTRSILASERIVLNFLQRLSGIATLTGKYVDLVSTTRAQICDTRKTTPGWRSLEKYAVRCGGGTNHRFSLYDAVLVKDNHLAAIKGGSLAEKLGIMVQNVLLMDNKPNFIEVEVDTLEQLEQVLNVDDIDIILLDNMTIEQMTKAVAMRDERCGTGKKTLLEASGGVNEQTVAAIAQTGVDRISVGALTHSVRNLDIALDF